MVRLAVRTLDAEDAWKDIVRINRKYRLGGEGQVIRRGTTCVLRAGANGPSKWVIVHGRESADPVIQMDLNVRLALEVKDGETHDFSLKPLSWIRSLWFPWMASDPSYRLPAQLGLLSALIGTILAVLGIVLSSVPILEHK
jgi:hypothetical protein